VPSLGEVYLNFVGKRTYGPPLFLQEALEYGFNRAIGNRPVPLDSYVLFAVWDKKGSHVYALGKVTGYSFLATEQEIKNAFAMLAQLEKQLQQSPDPQAKQDLQKMAQLLAKLYDALLGAQTGKSGDLIERGCGEYIEIIIDYDPKDFYELMVLFMRYFGKVPFNIFVRGHIMAYTLNKDFMLVLKDRPFVRGLVKVKISPEDWKKIMTTWKFIENEGIPQVAWLTNYKLLKSRRANERKLLLEVLRDKARERGGLDVLAE
jgi:hypothetical protein